MSETGLDKATETALIAMLALIVKKPLEQVGEIISIKMTPWQVENTLNAGEKVKRLLEQRGLTFEDLPAKYREILPALESVKNENDPTLQDMWASLLASSFDPDTPDFELPYAELLKLLSPLEAKLLQAMYSPNSPLRTIGFDYEAQLKAISEFLGVFVGEIDLAIQHLRHLGLLSTPELDNPLITFSPFVPLSKDMYQLTGVGRALMRRCTSLGEKSNHG